jgi:uncharacterized membrane protein YozB (DUF420 family)
MDAYTIVLTIHNLVRWIALVLGIVAVVLSVLGWFGRRPWTERERKLGSFFAITLDIQLLLGLLLYLFLSPITTAAFKDFGAAMGTDSMRFFVLEHSLYMLLAVVFAHLGSILPRRAKTDTAKFQRATIFLGLALLLILMGMPWMRPLLRF